MDERREAEHVGAAIPRAAGDPLGRGVRTAHRRGDADPLERAGDAEAGQPRVVGRQQHVARMQRAVGDVDGRGEVERAGQLRRDAQRVAGRRRPVLADDEVERLGGDVVLREIRGHAADAGRERRGDAPDASSSAAISRSNSATS